MLGTIIKKELQGNLSTFRFILTLLLTVAVFVASGVAFIGKYKNERMDYLNIKNTNLAGLEKQSAALNLIPNYVQTVRKEPSVTQLMAEGNEKSFPNNFRTDAFSIRYPEVESRSNFLFPRFADIDWTFIIAFILSFMAILMTFDSLSSEKHRGTLSLMMSNAVPRDKVIIGKYASGILTLAVPLFVGLIVNIIVVIIGGIPINGLGIKLIIFIALSLLYLSFFVLLGTLISSLSSQSSSSIVALLFFWVTLVIVIPSFGRFAAEKSVRVPTRAEFDEKFAAMYRQIWSNSEKFGKYAGNWGSGVEVNPPARAALFNAITEARAQVRDEYMNKIIAQANAGKNLSRISPTALYQYASEALAGTGVVRFERLYGQLKRYREILKEFVLAKDKEDPQSLHLLAEGNQHRRMLSARPVDFNAIPKFEEKDVPLGSALKNALRDIGILAGLNILLCLAVYFSFLKADIRQK